jgi:CHASE2 domain-containing sensor protein
MASRYPDNQCGPPSTEPRPYLDAARNFGRILAKAAFGSSWWGADTLQRCVYTDYAPLKAFFGLDVNSNPFLRQLIKDRAIVYGANITGVPDLVTSPVHGLVPGLFTHAMAADNLLTQGRDYWKEPPGVLGLINLATLFEIIVTLLAIAGTTYAMSKNKPWSGFFGAATFLLVLTIGWSWLLSFAPLNFVLMLGLTTLTQIIDGLRET